MSRLYFFADDFSYSSTFDDIYYTHMYDSLNVVNLSGIFFSLSEIAEEARIWDD